MICFYPLYPQQDYTELRFSLRSVEKYLKPKEVVIAGVYIPDWLINVTQLRIADRPGRKQLNIRRKIYAGLTYAKEILFLSDDVYLLKPYQQVYYSSGLLKKQGESGARIAEDVLRKVGKTEKTFDVHSPIFYQQDFKEIMQVFPAGSVIKSAYGNYKEVESVEMWDCKVDKKMKPEEIYSWIQDRPYFSTGHQGISSALPVLQELFPNKSKYEL